MRTFLFVLLLAIMALASAGTVCAQTRESRAPGSEAGDEPEPDYEPYVDEEFPDWLHKVRRAEVVFIGSFPVTLLFSSLAYEGYRSISLALEQTAEAPAFDSGQLSDAESRGVLIAGLGLAAVVSLIDFILVLSEEKRAE